MSEILLVRHALSYANIGDLSFGRKESPLTKEGEKSGIAQAVGLHKVFEEQFGVIPSTYVKPVLASEYLRAQQTAQFAGFENIDVEPVINEWDIGELTGQEVIRKHATEDWIPTEMQKRAAEFIQLIRQGRLRSEIYFTHGLFIASVLSHLQKEAAAYNRIFSYPWTEARGYIPRLATIIPVQI